MIFKFDNNVLSTLASAVSAGATSISIALESGVNNPPPDPDGGTAVLTLVDDLASPTKMEVIYYTGRTGAGPYTLTGVQKGREGTDDQSWDAGDFVFQDQTLETVVSAPLMHSNTIAQDSRLPDNYNALMVGPVTVASGKTLTVGANSTMVIQ